MEHSITLTVEQELTPQQARQWYKSVSETISSGITTSIQVDTKAVQMVKAKDKESVRYSIPLTRDLTDSEVNDVISCFAHCCDIDFKVSATTTSLDTEMTTDVVVDQEPLLNLCTKWAKDKHEEWRRNKEATGWRYGPMVSKASQTHPLLRAWEELPDDHRKVDTSQPQELLNLLYNSGYVLIRADDLDRLLGE